MTYRTLPYELDRRVRPLGMTLGIWRSFDALGRARDEGSAPSVQRQNTRCITRCWGTHALVSGAGLRSYAVPSGGPLPNDLADPGRVPNAARPACVVSSASPHGDDLVGTVEESGARGRA